VNASVLLSTFGLIFLAELGDKTQLAAMALATRYPWKKIFLGVAAAFVLLNLGAVAVGKVLFTVLPPVWVKVASGALFTFFGVKTLLASRDEATADAPPEGAGRPLLTAFTMILLAELGDKTQLATAGLAAQQNAPFEVFAGSTAALWAVTALGILLGSQLTRFVPLHWVQRSAGCLFLLFGAAAFYQAFS
jgi:Ca2+/H+ antiporter, TMEM165/GDT1 family